MGIYLDKIPIPFNFRIPIQIGSRFIYRYDSDFRKEK